MTSHPTALPAGNTWDLFCRVVDNHGDVGVCWRLARGLAERGAAVRLWLDDASALAWMAAGWTPPAGTPASAPPPACDPQHAAHPPGVTVHPFDAAAQAWPGSVVVEAFGCDPPAAFVRRMANRPCLPGRDDADPCPPVWINLEYLSAESYVERCHGLSSPQSSASPGAGLVKWFFYPGFTARTGGLMRRADVDGPAQARAPGAQARLQRWFAERGVALSAGGSATRLSLFCYPSQAVHQLLDHLSQRDAAQAVDLLVTPGHAAACVDEWLAVRQHPALCLNGAAIRRGPLTLHALPPLPQVDFDVLLSLCDLNIVRGEDSLISALAAARPFIWHIYRQHDGAHHAKLSAFLAHHLVDARADVDAPCRAAHRYWNADTPPPDAVGAVMAHLSAASTHHAHLAGARTAALPDLVTTLMNFAAGKAQMARQSPAS